MFQEMELSSPKLKKLLYFRRELAKPENKKNGLYFFLIVSTKENSF